MNFKRKSLFFFIFFIFFLPVVFAQSEITFPSPQGFVNDYANVLSADVEREMERVCRVLNEKTGIEIAVVFLDTTKPLDMPLYSVKLFEKWGIGKKGQDNGVLFITAVKDRKTRIEVGYGLEEILTDGYCGEILDNVIPYFAKSDYNNGAITAFAGIVSKIAEKKNINLKEIVSLRERKNYRKSSNIRNLIGLIILFFFIFSRTGFLPFFLFGRRYRYGRYRMGGFGGFGSFGGGLGGFGGFGGGLSGGGGAGRSW